MRKVVLMMSVSLDGYFEGPGHELDWHLVDDELHPKIVFSRTLTEAGWDTTVVREVVAAEIMELKARPGGDLALGGADLAATFRRLGLIDEYRLYVHPVVLGAGTPLFRPSGTRTDLRPAGNRVFGNGVVLLRYERPGS